jgi:single-strand DNA-binding protein
MSKGFVKVTLLGNLGNDPETRFMPNGDQVTSISVACTEHYTDKSGAKQEVTEWVRVTFFRKLAEIAGQYLRKGSQVFIEGKMKTRKYEKEGVTHYSTEVIASELTMLGGKPGNDTDGQQSDYQTPVDGSQYDDSIPF